MIIALAFIIIAFLLLDIRARERADRGERR